MQCAVVTSTVFITWQTQQSPGEGFDISHLMQYKASRARIRCIRHSEARKNRSAQEIWVGTKVGYGYRALLLGPCNNELNAHRPSNPNKLFRYSFKITNLRLCLLPTNVSVQRNQGT